MQRLEAMLGPVRSALIGACERDDELKQLLLKRAGSKADALSKFVDGEQSLDDLLQVRHRKFALFAAVSLFKVFVRCQEASISPDVRTVWCSLR